MYILGTCPLTTAALAKFLFPFDNISISDLLILNLPLNLLEF
jgi:hypothetical protein